MNSSSYSNQSSDKNVDEVEAYFECITTCSLDDGDCITKCVQDLRDSD